MIIAILKFMFPNSKRKAKSCFPWNWQNALNFKTYKCK